MSEAPDVSVVYDWVDTTPMFSVDLTKQSLEDGSTQIVATCPNAPDLNPCYGEEVQDAIEAINRRIWTYVSSGRNVALANAEPDR
jgi:hypothetical protein